MDNSGPNKGDKTYHDTHNVWYIRVTYVMAVMLWVIVIYVLKLYQTTVLGWCILFIPLIVFVISFGSASYLTVDVEDKLFQYNYLTIGILLVLPLITWITRDFAGDTKRLIGICVVAIVFAMLSMIDIWVTREWLSVVKHIKSVFQTMALTLLIFTFYLYYTAVESKYIGSIE